MFRTHTCGQLRKEDESALVTLSGWVHSRRDHGGVIFIDLRDKYGITQIKFNPDINKESWNIADSVRSEYVVRVEGTVALRPQEMVNQKISTGEIEISAKEIEILNTSKTPPFEIATEEKHLKETNEELRLKYRFLDLRRKRMQENLEFRAKMIKHIHDWMNEHGFTEVHTPILTASSPEGARDFLVPSRINPGKFYALPQAPQQYKQLLMVGGVDKYYQIAPCMRDEDPRADRSPGEFYQLDLETSFLTQDEFFEAMEPLFIELTEKVAGKKVWKKPFPRITYKEIMGKYGSDRPDLRFGLELHDITGKVKKCGFKVFADAVKSGGVVKALNAKGAGGFTRAIIEDLTEFAKGHGAKGLAYIVVEKDGLKSPITKFLGDALAREIVAELSGKPGDIIFFGADKEDAVNKVLSQVRARLGKELGLIDENILAWAWVVDFPMYEYSEQEGKIDFSHNPFSMPQEGMDALQNKDPLDILAHQYDIICNGYEISSGAVRNNRPDIMFKAFEIAGYTEKQVRDKFGHMISAFEYGAPPHCGFAPGIERMIMVFLGENNIREVVPFPKNQKAEDLMMGAPSEVDPKQLAELYIKVVETE